MTPEEWVLLVFDPDADYYPWPPGRDDLANLTRLFADPVTSVGGLDDETIGIGLWNVLDPGGAGTTFAVGDTDLPITDRVACVRAIPTLYRDLLAPRCAPRLGHLGEQEGRLEMIAYMFWDIAAFGGVEGTRNGNLLEDAVLETLDDILHIDHAACQEGAIHGLGHRFPRHPERVPAILRTFLRRGPIADDRLVPYAESAMSGCIL